jgi:nucleotide-binding universal stress UspA family protein
MDDSSTPPAVIVGVDGSNAAMHAALWAVGEAIDRDVPLRLLCALDQEGTSPIDVGDTARRLANAEIAGRYVFTAVEAIEKPVKVEVEICEGAPTSKLLRASRSAAMVCVGAVGLNHFQPGRVGSTAAALAVSAHCPVAIVRGNRAPHQPRDRCIVVEADESPGNGVVLEAAVKEARLRNAPLRLITCWQPWAWDRLAAAERDRRIRAQLDRRLVWWRRRYPDLRVEAMAVHGGMLDYLGKHAAEAQLLVLGARVPGHVLEVVGSAGNAAMGNSDCVLLVVDHQHL